LARLPLICLILVICMLLLVSAEAIVIYQSSIKSVSIENPDRGPASFEMLAEQLEETASINERIREERRGWVSITISFAGDCTLGTDEAFPYQDSLPQRLEKEGFDYSYFFRGVSSVFEADDLTIVNLETTLTEASSSADKRFRFRGHPSYTNILKSGSVELVNISNNHIYDYLDEGFNDTVKALDEAGIGYCGEGHIAYLEIKGIRIACVGKMVWKPGVNADLKRDIRNAKENADIVIVSLHWGIEGTYYPDEFQRRLGCLCIDEGADIVMGHHPHVIQGIEKYKERYIVYSLGNFCFGGNRNPADKDTFIFQSHFTLKDGEVCGVEISVIPCSISSVDYINDYQPTVLEEAERERVLNRIIEYSKKLEYGIGVEDLN